MTSRHTHKKTQEYFNWFEFYYLAKKKRRFLVLKNSDTSRLESEKKPAFSFKYTTCLHII